MPLTTTSAPRQLSDGNTVGTVLGTGPTDNIGFFGDASPGPQPSGAAQAAIVRGQQAGLIAVFGSAQTPAAIPGSQTAEFAMSTVINASALFRVATTDLLFVNKPTSQAGLGVGNVRGSAANGAGVTFSNLTAVTITPTAAEKYGIVAIRGMPTISVALTPASVPAASIIEQIFTVAGLRAGDLVQVNKPSAQAGLDIVGCRVAGANLLGITYMNCTVLPITPTVENYIVFGLGGIDAVNNLISVQAMVGTPTGVQAGTCAEQNIILNGLAITDAVVGISKPTAQAGLGIAGQRTQTSANSLAITYANPTGTTITPTATEVYSVLVNRPNPTAPMVNYSQALTPTSVPANSSAEQTFTVNGLVAGSAVWVNKPAAQLGLGIAGVRVSAVNQLAVNYVNTSAISITPTAGEVYMIGNFQQSIPDASNSFAQVASAANTAQSILANAIRTALSGSAGLNLIAGA